MKKNKYLNEESYQKTKKRISLTALLVLIIGLGIGVFLLYKGIFKPSASKVEELKVVLENKKSELENKGIRYNTFAKYTDGEEYDLKIITNAMDPSFSHCEFDEYKNNSLTKEYCAAKNSVSDFTTYTYIGLGIFIIIATCMISFFIFFVSKGREVAAFTAQQAIPIAKEGIKEMTPSIGNVAKEITKGIKKKIKGR